jgi:hypothetical protein
VEIYEGGEGVIWRGGTDEEEEQMKRGKRWRRGNR